MLTTKNGTISLQSREGSNRTGSKSPSSQEGNRGGDRTGVLQQALHHPKKDWRHQASVKSPPTKSICSTSVIQNGNLKTDMPFNKEKRFSHQYRLKAMLFF